MNLLKQTDAIKSECKGYFYRGKVNTYYDGTNLRDDRRLVKLKRRSCKGCEECEWLDDTLKESLGYYPFLLDFLQHGIIYKLIITSSKYGGIDFDGFDFIFKEVIEPEEK